MYTFQHLTSGRCKCQIALIICLRRRPPPPGSAAPQSARTQNSSFKYWWLYKYSPASPSSYTQPLAVSNMNPSWDPRPYVRPKCHPSQVLEPCFRVHVALALCLHGLHSPPRRADFFQWLPIGCDSLLAQHPLQQVHARDQVSWTPTPLGPLAAWARWRWWLSVLKSHFARACIGLFKQLLSKSEKRFVRTHWL
jgi:hypothetical protein